MTDIPMPKSCLPEDIEVFGIHYEVYEVEIVDRDDPACVGKCDLSEATIKIDTNLNSQVKRQTLIHEVVHAILESLSLHEESANEVLVQGIAAGIYNTWGDKIFKEVE